MGHAREQDPQECEAAWGSRSSATRLAWSEQRQEAGADVFVEDAGRSRAR